jgi:hypothetical protein
MPRAKRGKFERYLQWGMYQRAVIGASIIVILTQYVAAR